MYGSATAFCRCFCVAVLLFSGGTCESDDLFKLSAQSNERSMRAVRMVHAISAIKFENDETAVEFAYVCIASAPSEAM